MDDPVSRVDDILSDLSPDDYDQLPLSIRSMFSREEFMWLPDDRKALITQTETEPEWEE